MLVIWRSLIIIYGTATIRSELRTKDEKAKIAKKMQVQIANIYRLAIKDKKIMVTALPVQQQTAGTLTVGYLLLLLPIYHFSRGDSLIENPRHTTDQVKGRSICITAETVIYAYACARVRVCDMHIRIP